MKRDYNINMLYQIAFGFRGMPFPFVPPPTQITEAKQSIDSDMARHSGNLQYTDGLTPYAMNGAPLFMPTGFILDGAVRQLPNEPIVTCSIKKRITETSLAGNTRKGTVKEIINTEDWRIKIQGLCIDFYKQSFPEDELEMINALYEENRSIEVVNYALNNVLGIKNVVMSNLAVRTLRGNPFAVAYEIDLIADEDFLLFIQ